MVETEILRGKTVVLTGAAGGIGRVIARMVADRGGRLLLIDPNEAGARDLADSLPGGPHPVVASILESPEACEEALAAIDGPVHALVHMAGLFERHELTPDARPIYDRAIASNLTNGFDLAMALMERLPAEEPIRMVFASSLAFRRGSTGRVAYSAAKGGVVGLVRGLARNLGPRALVNGIAPGVIETPMIKEIAAERGDSMRAEIPLQRLGKPEEVANVVLFLIGPDSTYITGQIINVDGGLISS